MRKKLKAVLDGVGLGGVARKAVVESRMVGERLRFARRGRPAPESSIVVFGSGRSGTTWLADSLASMINRQVIFEPLNKNHFSEIESLTDGWGYPYYLRPDSDRADWEHFLHRALTGQLRNYWTDNVRTSVWPEGYVVKLVRACMLIGYINQNFHPQLIWVVRHPCAVVASKLNAKPPWHPRPAKLLLQTELVEDYLSLLPGSLETIDNIVEANAALYAIENAIALNQLRDVRHCRVHYEELLLSPDATLNRILQFLNQHNTEVNTSLLKVPSRMTHVGKSYQNSEQRLTAWQKQLTAEEIDVILSWCRHTNLPWYDDTPLPIGYE